MTYVIIGGAGREVMVEGLGKRIICSNRRSSELLYYIVILTLLSLLLYGCGSTFDNSSSSGISSYSSSENGSLALNLDNNSWAEASAAMVTPSAPSALNAIALTEPSQTEKKQVKVLVYFGNTLLVSDTWSYGSSSGVVEDIPPGPKRRIVVLITNSSGEILYWGEKYHVTILKDETTNIGTIETSQFTPEISEVLSAKGEISIKWDSVPGASNYTVYWSTTSPEVTASSCDGIFSTANTSFDMTGLQDETIYFCAVRAENAYGKSPLSSMAIAVPGGYDILTSEGIQDDDNTFSFNFGQEIDPNESEIEKAVLTLVNNSDNKEAYTYRLSGSELDNVGSDAIIDVTKIIEPCTEYTLTVSNQGDSKIDIHDVRLILLLKPDNS